MLTKEKMYAMSARLERKEIPIPQWDGETLLIRELTGGEREEIESMVLRSQKTNNYAGLRSTILRAGVINEDGTPMFTKKDEAMLESLSAKALESVFNEILIMSGMKPLDEEGNGNSSKGSLIE